MPVPELRSILVFPLKSGDAQPVHFSRALPSGCLEHDRRWALMDDVGRFWNGKRTPLFHRWRTWVNTSQRILAVTYQKQEFAWQLDSQRSELEQWFSQQVNGPVHLCENAERGFPDDGEASGPTLISTATLMTVTEWFPSLTVAQVRARFRTNLEITGVDPFWEDRAVEWCLSGGAIRIGTMVLKAVKICQRCVVPSRDPFTGDVLTGFAAHFSAWRARALPADVRLELYPHWYRLAVNTQLLSGHATIIKTGDRVELIK
ncbi:MAG: molybdenum cofactor biosynthesis protein [Planctomycetaceae bacterium]|nr:MAG: molybdenum cofactor biosynthesis protein [Planctomycetaceae bacterium]